MNNLNIAIFSGCKACIYKVSFKYIQLILNIKFVIINSIIIRINVSKDTFDAAVLINNEVQTNKFNKYYLIDNFNR